MPGTQRALEALEHDVSRLRSSSSARSSRPTGGTAELSIPSVGAAPTRRWSERGSSGIRSRSRSRRHPRQCVESDAPRRSCAARGRSL